MSFEPPYCSLTPEQLKFETEFAKWEDGFRQWQRQNSNAIDIEAKRRYEAQFLVIRDKLLKKRSQIYGHTNQNNSNIQKDLDFQLLKATEHAEQILNRYPAAFNPSSCPMPFDREPFRMHPGGNMYNNHPNNPNPNGKFWKQRQMMNQPMMNRNRPMMMNKNRPMMNRNGNVKTKEEIEKSAELFKQKFEAAKLVDNPKPLKTQVRVRYKRLLTKPAESLNVEEKALIECFHYVSTKRSEFFRKKKEAENAAAASTSTAVSDSNAAPETAMEVVEN